MGPRRNGMEFCVLKLGLFKFTSFSNEKKRSGSEDEKEAEVLVILPHPTFPPLLS